MEVLDTFSLMDLEMSQKTEAINVTIKDLDKKDAENEPIIISDTYKKIKEKDGSFWITEYTKLELYFDTILKKLEDEDLTISYFEGYVSKTILLLFKIQLKDDDLKGAQTDKPLAKIKEEIDEQKLIFITYLLKSYQKSRIKLPNGRRNFFEESLKLDPIQEYLHVANPIYDKIFDLFKWFVSWIFFLFTFFLTCGCFAVNFQKKGCCYFCTLKCELNLKRLKLKKEGYVTNTNRFFLTIWRWCVKYLFRQLISTLFAGLLATLISYLINAGGLKGNSMGSTSNSTNSTNTTKF